MASHRAPPLPRTEADAARYAGWYADPLDDGTEPLVCALCGSSEDVSHGGPDGDTPLCLDCAERPSPSVWDPYYAAVYGAE